MSVSENSLQETPTRNELLVAIEGLIGGVQFGTAGACGIALPAIITAEGFEDDWMLFCASLCFLIALPLALMRGTMSQSVLLVLRAHGDVNHDFTKGRPYWLGQSSVGLAALGLVFVAFRISCLHGCIATAFALAFIPVLKRYTKKILPGRG